MHSTSTHRKLAHRSSSCIRAARVVLFTRVLRDVLVCVDVCMLCDMCCTHQSVVVLVSTGQLAHFRGARTQKQSCSRDLVRHRIRSPSLSPPSLAISLSLSPFRSHSYIMTLSAEWTLQVHSTINHMLPVLRVCAREPLSHTTRTTDTLSRTHKPRPHHHHHHTHEHQQSAQFAPRLSDTHGQQPPHRILYDMHIRPALPSGIPYSECTLRQDSR